MTSERPHVLDIKMSGAKMSSFSGAAQYLSYANIFFFFFFKFQTSLFLVRVSHLGNWSNPVLTFHTPSPRLIPLIVWEYSYKPENKAVI